jgi:hypothetical protein
LLATNIGGYRIAKEKTGNGPGWEPFAGQRKQLKFEEELVFAWAKAPRLRF